MLIKTELAFFSLTVDISLLFMKLYRSTHFVVKLFLVNIVIPPCSLFVLGVHLFC